LRFQNLCETLTSAIMITRTWSNPSKAARTQQHSRSADK